MVGGVKVIFREGIDFAWFASINPDVEIAYCDLLSTPKILKTLLSTTKVRFPSKIENVGEPFEVIIEVVVLLLSRL